MRSTFFGSMLNFFLPMAICLFLWDVLLQHRNKNVPVFHYLFNHEIVCEVPEFQTQKYTLL